MTRSMAIAGRELRAYFLSPGAYVITSLFLLVTGFFFFAGFEQGQLASLRSVFGIGAWMLSIIGPAITMRLVSEEYRLGTYETLITAPLREGEVILGKFLGSVGFLLVLLLPTLAYVVALEHYGRPDYGELMCGYLGMMLAGMAYLASGLLASTLTTSQSVAFLMTVFFWLGLGVATKLLPAYLGERLAGIVFAADPDLRLRDFTIGLVDTSDVVYFLSITIFCLAAATRSLQWRRWR